MSSTLQRKVSLQRLLARLLEEPELVTLVQALPARALGRLIDHVGVEDAGELVALATPAQLRDVLDDDLWHSARPGADERFDGARFALWLEVLVEAGDEVAARKLTELPEELVFLALHRQVLVLDLDSLAVEMSARFAGRGQGGADLDGAEQLEKALEGCLFLELEQYRVVARRHEGWDALATVLTALDRHHHPYLRRLLERLCDATASYLEDHGGLHEVLTSEEMLEVDAAAERADRRAAEGFVAPSAATSLLALARGTPLDELERALGPDPVTRAYFREYAPTVVAPGATRPAGSSSAGGVERLLGLLADAGVDVDGLGAAPARAVGLLPGAEAAPGAVARQRLERALAELAERQPALAQRRLGELGYLANVVAAGVSSGGRALRPLEASAAALATCALGLDHLVARGPASSHAELALAAVADAGIDRLFRIGVHLGYRDVAAPALAALDRGLARAEQGASGAALARLGWLRRAVGAAAAAKRPWAVRGTLSELCERAELAAALPWLGAALGELPAATGADGEPRWLAARGEVAELAAGLERLAAS